MIFFLLRDARRDENCRDLARNQGAAIMGIHENPHSGRVNPTVRAGKTDFLPGGVGSDYLGAVDFVHRMHIKKCEFQTLIMPQPGRGWGQHLKMSIRTLKMADFWFFAAIFVPWQ